MKQCLFIYKTPPSCSYIPRWWSGRVMVLGNFSAGRPANLDNSRARAPVAQLVKR